MQSFGRRLFVSVSVLSLILCLATVGLWIAASNRMATWGSTSIKEYPGQMPEYGLWMVNGSVYFWRWYPIVVETSPPHPRRRVEFLGFGVDRGFRNLSRDGAGPYEAYACTVKVPLGTLTVLTSLLPIWSVWMFIRHNTAYYRGERMRALGLCERCGYDLRASPERCPECGQVLAADERR